MSITMHYNTPLVLYIMEDLSGYTSNLLFYPKIRQDFHPKIYTFQVYLLCNVHNPNLCVIIYAVVEFMCPESAETNK